MSFQSLRPNNILYILSKNNGMPSLEQGVIVNVTAPIPKYGSPIPYGQPTEMVVDLTVKVGDKTGSFNKVPANSEVYDCTPTMTIAISRDAINSELSAIRQRSIEIVNSKAHNEEVITQCDRLLSELNPELAEKQAQAQEIATLKSQVAELSQSIKDFIAIATQRKEEVGHSERGTKKEK